MYNQKVIDIFKNPKNMGFIEDYDAYGKVGNAKCGDIMEITMKIDDKTKVITDIKFRTFGCTAAIATSSVATELVKGKTLDEAAKITNADVVKKVGGELPQAKLHCSVLAEEAIAAAIKNYYSKKENK